MSQKVTDKQLYAANMIVLGKLTREITDTMQIRRETLSRWKRQPAFIEALEELRREKRARFQERLSEISRVAVDAIYDELKRPHCDAKCIQAALNVLYTFGLPVELAPQPPEAPAAPLMLTQEVHAL